MSDRLSNWEKDELHLGGLNVHVVERERDRDAFTPFQQLAGMV